jgi:Tfp pilus assembly protein PilO
MAKSIPRITLSRRGNTLAIVAAVCVLLLCADRFVVTPVRERMEVLDLGIRNARLELKKYQKIMQQRAAVEADWEVYKPRIEPKVSTREVHHQAMLAAIEELGQKSNVVLGRTTEGEVKTMDFLEEYPVNVEVEGTVLNMVQFLHGLQQHTELLRVRTMTLLPKGKPGEMTLKGSLEVTKVLAL